MDNKPELNTPFEDLEHLYNLSAFDILKISPDERDLKKIKRAVKDLSLKSQRSEIVIKDIKVTAALIQRAGKISESPLHRIAEEIAAHRPHYIDKEALKDYIEEGLNTQVQAEDCQVYLKLDLKKLVENLPEPPRTPPSMDINIDFIDLNEECFEQDIREDIVFEV